MADVFISYSRQDREFVRRLHEALAVRDRDSWVDWEDIPPTAEWLAEIFGAIEGANAFLFILSPDSATSKVCLEELAHAVENNKRLIPVVCREVGSKDTPESLSKLNWIFLRETDDFDAGVEKLLDAVDTDLDWVKAHTRLLTRAIEWDRQLESRYKKSLLLRGGDLEKAEQWLAQSGDKEPKPTDLQGQFILASRQGETRRKRQIMGGLLIGLLVVALALAVALYQYLEADRQYRLADKRGRIALSRQLAAQSTNFLESRLDLSLLLGVAATKVADTVEAKSSLLEGVLHKPRLVSFLQGHKTSVEKVAFSPDGRFLASAEKYSTIMIWKVESRRPHGSPLKGHSREIEGLAFSPNSEILASAGSDHTVRLWEVEHARPLGSPLAGHTKPVKCVAFSPDGSLLASAGDEDAIILWEPKTRKLLGKLQLSAGHTHNRVNFLVFSPDGRILASMGYRDDKNQAVVFWDVERQQTLDPPIDGPSEGGWLTMKFSPDGKTLVLGELEDLSLWDVAIRRKVGSLWDKEISRQVDIKQGYRTMACIKYLAFSPDGKILAAAGGGKLLYFDYPKRQLSGEPIITVYGNTIRTSFGFTKILESGAVDHKSVPIFSAAIHPNLETLAIGGDSLSLWEVDRERTLSQLSHNLPYRVEKVGFSRDGRILAIPKGIRFSTDSKIELWDTMRHQFLDPLFLPGYFISQDSDILTVGNSEGAMTFWDIHRRQPVGKPPEGHDTSRVTSACFSPDGRIYAYALKDQTIRLWDVAKRQYLSQPLKENNRKVFCLEFSPDGKTLAYVRGAHLFFWDVERQQPQGPALRLKNHRYAVHRLLFSPDGKILATGSIDEIVFWDTANRRILGPLSVSSSVRFLYLKMMAFSPDGHLLAAADDQGSIGLWDVAQRRPLTTKSIFRPAAQPDIRALAFTPDGDMLMSVDFSGEILFHDMRVSSWQALACRRANRNLTKEEWQRYMGNDIPYRKTCPNLPGPGDEKPSVATSSK